MPMYNNTLSLAQIALLFDEGGFQQTWEKAFFGLCLYAGCRPKQACTLLTEDVFGVLGRVRPTLLIRAENSKLRRDREIPIHSRLREYLEAYGCPDQRYKYLFPGRDKGHIHLLDTQLILYRACDRVGIPSLSIHCFRHTFAHTLLSKLRSGEL